MVLQPPNMMIAGQLLHNPEKMAVIGSTDTLTASRIRFDLTLEWNRYENKNALQ
ncbi:hypothetical protein ASZ90_019073 [hydrocarbon metagenome]|uniref:Uncharacterized protein n=1 Tax=hydrocarbon metagenome TaxID=938273 RepID=A0A0W8E4C4_9ZZZZ